MHTPGGEPRVPVADDNKDAAETLGTLLETAGYEVETCSDGPAALRVAGRFGPDACVLDVRMPGRDGYELDRRLRANDPDHPPVLATVTPADSEDYGHLEKAAAAGFDLHFAKPTDFRAVAEQIGDCVRRHDREREAARAADSLAGHLPAEIDEDDEAEVDTGNRCWLAVGGMGLVLAALAAFAAWQAA